MYLKVIFVVLLCLSLFCGCSAPIQDSPLTTIHSPSEDGTVLTQLPETNSSPLTSEAAEETTTEGEADPVTLVSDALAEVTFFEYHCLYMELAAFGFEQNTTQTTARDGSFHFKNETRFWDHGADWEQSQKVEYYYYYENDSLRYYMRENAGTLQHGSLTKKDEANLLASKDLVMGTSVILPSYLEDFSQVGDETGTLCFCYSIPTQKVLADQTIVSSFLDTALYYSQTEASALAETQIHCTLWVDPETMRPTRLYQDYRELKPYLLSLGSQSGEFALETDLLYVELLFGYDASETTVIPDDFLK